MTRKGSLRSPRHTEQYHGGKVPGAGEVRTGEPGSFARGVKSVVGRFEKPAAKGGSIVRNRDCDEY